MSKNSSKEQDEIKSLKENQQNILNQLNQVTAQAIQLKDVAQSNEIILNRTIRYITGKLLKLRKDPTKENIDALIEDLNKIEEQAEQNVSAAKEITTG